MIKHLLVLMLLTGLILPLRAAGQLQDRFDLTQRKVAILIAEGFRDDEARFPEQFLRDRGAEVTFIGPAGGTVKAYNSDFTIRIEKAVSEIDAAEFDALVIPGGLSPAALRENPGVIRLVQDFAQGNKIIAAICYGPQVLISAGILAEKMATGNGGIRDEMIQAGAIYQDLGVVRDENLITSRVPGDLPEFSREIARALLGLDDRLEWTAPTPADSAPREEAAIRAEEAAVRSAEAAVRRQEAAVRTEAATALREDARERRDTVDALRNDLNLRGRPPRR